MVYWVFGEFSLCIELVVLFGEKACFVGKADGLLVGSVVCWERAVDCVFLDVYGEYVDRYFFAIQLYGKVIVMGKVEELFECSSVSVCLHAFCKGNA